MNHPLPLLGRADRQAARQLVERCDLRFEAGFDDLIGVFDGARLIGCGARAGRVLKMLVVDPDYRGGGLVGEIVTELMARGHGAGCDGFFIFTQPCTALAFEQLGFRRLVSHPRAVLLEHGPELERYWRRQAPLVRPGHNAGLIVAGERLDEGELLRALEGHDHLYLLVPGDGSLARMPTCRLEELRRAVAHLPSVTVTDLGPYRLDAATFPGYFLKPGLDRDTLRRELDRALFEQHIAPLFHIQTLHTLPPAAAGNEVEP